MLVPSVSRADNNQPNIFVNGQEVVFSDQLPFVEEGTLRVFVPLDKMAAALGCAVGKGTADFVGATTITRGTKTITVVPGASIPLVNGVPIDGEINDPILMVGDTAYIPLRLISELMGATVTWESGKIVIEDPGAPHPIVKTENLLSEIKLWVPNDKGLHNVRLAAGFINGTVIKSGDEFSFNRVVGRRTAARGFVEAGVFLVKNGKHIMGKEVGGGVCRMSTAMYQAVRKAGLPTTERHGHSQQVKYAKPGDDASVYWNVWDYRFRNTRKLPIRIDVKVEGSTIHVTISELLPKKAEPPAINPEVQPIDAPVVIEPIENMGSISSSPPEGVPLDEGPRG